MIIISIFFSYAFENIDGFTLLPISYQLKYHFNILISFVSLEFKTILLYFDVYLITMKPFSVSRLFFVASLSKSFFPYSAPITLHGSNRINSGAEFLRILTLAFEKLFQVRLLRVNDCPARLENWPRRVREISVKLLPSSFRMFIASK